LTVAVKSVKGVLTMISEKSSALPCGASVKCGPLNNVRSAKYDSKPKGLCDEIKAKIVRHLDIFFSPEKLARFLYNALITQVLEKCTDEAITPAGFNAVLGRLMFALGKSDRKEEYKRGNGPIASTLRRRKLVRALGTRQRNTYGIFRDSAVEGSAAAEEGEKRPTQPELIAKKMGIGKPYVEYVHMDMDSSDMSQSVEIRRLFTSACVSLTVVFP